MLKTVRRGFVISISMLLSLLAEDQGFLVQEQMPLHGLEPGKVLHFCRTFSVSCPHTERSLHQHFPQFAQVTLVRV